MSAAKAWSMIFRDLLPGSGFPTPTKRPKVSQKERVSSIAAIFQVREICNLRKTLDGD
jgi:hypothetical protein